MTDTKKHADESLTKSQLKNEMHDLQKIGEQLINLSDSQLESFVLPEFLKDAIVAARKLKNDESRRRQLQYIGKLMREVDMAPIKLGLQEIRYSKESGVRHFHQTEMWREKLIANGDVGINEFVSLHPQADRQQLRTLVRNAQVDRQKNKKSGAEKALFKYLFEQIKE